MVFKQEPPAAMYFKEDSEPMEDEKCGDFSSSDDDDNEKNTFTCKTCGVAFMSDIEYNCHVYNDNLDLFVCCKCGSKFVDEKTIWHHMRDHTLSQNSNVVLLPNKTKLITDLAKSGKLIDSRINNKFICKYCDQDFIKRDDFYNHVMAHMGNATRKHNVENNTTRRRTVESKTKRKRSIKDNATKKRTVENVAFNGHPVSDCFKVERLYSEIAGICNLCGQGFNTAPKQRRHQKICTGKNIWACTVCKYKFKSSSYLFLHFDIAHRQIKRMCKFCFTVFENEKLVIKHILETHLDYMYYCFSCSEGFFSLSTYETHCRLH